MEIEGLKKFMGGRILELREKNKYSKKDVRAKTDISEQMQKQYENGDIKKLPAIDVLLRLSELYQVPISYFFPDTYNMPVKSDKYQISSIYEAAKTIVDLSLAKGVTLYIEKKDELSFSKDEKFSPDDKQKYKDFTIRLTDNATAYNEITKHTYDDNTIFLAYEGSIMYQFLDKIYNYLDLYYQNKLDIDDYKSLCEKALNTVKEREAKEKDYNRI